MASKKKDSLNTTEDKIFLKIQDFVQQIIQITSLKKKLLETFIHSSTVQSEKNIFKRKKYNDRNQENIIHHYL